MSDDLGIAGVGRLRAEDDRSPARPAELLVHERELELAVTGTAEVGPEVTRPQAGVADFSLQWVDEITQLAFERVVRQAREHEIDGLDLVGEELVDPVELVLELRVGLEIPCHGPDTSYGISSTRPKA